MFERDKSEKSTTLQAEASPDNYIIWINQLTKENQFKSQALKTAQNLIKKYRLDNQALKEENISLRNKLKQEQQENKVLQSIISKLNRRDFNQVCYKQQSNNQKLNDLVLTLISKQEQYEDKVNNLENTIMLLQKHLESSHKAKEKIINPIIQLKAIKYTKQNLFPEEDKIHNQGIIQANKKKHHSKLSELRSLHIKLKHHDTELNDKKAGLVSRIFSEDKLQSHHQLTSQSETKNMKKKDKGLMTPKKVKQTQKNRRKCF